MDTVTAREHREQIVCAANFRACGSCGAVLETTHLILGLAEGYTWYALEGGGAYVVGDNGRRVEHWTLEELRIDSPNVTAVIERAIRECEFSPLEFGL